MEGHSGASDNEQSPTTKCDKLKKTKANNPHSTFPKGLVGTKGIRADDDYNCKLPKGLVGTTSIAQVKISGNPTTCLLDTGSQDTAIPMSYCAQFLVDQPIKPLTILLERCLILVIFPKDFVGTDGSNS